MNKMVKTNFEHRDSQSRKDLTMSKGEELDKLLDEAEKVHQQMNDIFKHYNVKPLDLISLPQKGKEKWDHLFKQKDEITEQIGKLFK